MSIQHTRDSNGIWRLRTASLDHYDSEFLDRLELFWGDPRVGERFYVHSGSRSRAHQALLYAKFRAGVGNPANKPGTSKHEWSSTQGALAVDMHPTPGKGGTYGEMQSIAREYGFHFPFANRAAKAEPWHAEHATNRPSLSQLETRRSPVDDRSEEDDLDMPKPDDFVATIQAPGGGAWKIQFNGGVHTVEPAPFFGSIPMLKPEEKQGVKQFYDGRAGGPTANDGYVILRVDGEEFRFDAQWREDHSDRF